MEHKCICTDPETSKGRHCLCSRSACFWYGCTESLHLMVLCRGWSDSGGCSYVNWSVSFLIMSSLFSLLDCSESKCYKSDRSIQVCIEYMLYTGTSLLNQVYWIWKTTILRRMKENLLRPFLSLFSLQIAEYSAILSNFIVQCPGEAIYRLFPTLAMINDNFPLSIYTQSCIPGVRNRWKSIIGKLINQSKPIDVN